jgi:hypothetical protein
MSCSPRVPSSAEYRDLGASYLDTLDAQRVTGNLVRRLERLGYDVAISKRPEDGPAVREPTEG